MQPRCGRIAGVKTRLHPLVSLLAVAAALGLAGCGEEEPTAQQPAASSPASTPAPAAAAATATTAPVEEPEAEEPEAEPAPDPTIARDKRRAKKFLKDYGADARSRWRIKSVTVEDGAVTVKTSLFPKASNEPQFTGACSALMDWEDWMTSLEVLGSDGSPHATWADGDVFCDVNV